MTQWITDRLPTLEDADSDGDVLIKTRLHPQDWGAFMHFSLVVHGIEWRSPISGAEAAAASIAEAAAAGQPRFSAFFNQSPPPAEDADPMEQARLERYRAKTKLVEARATLILAQARAIVFTPHT